MNEEFKVGDRVEWCRDGDFAAWGSVTSGPTHHDFGTVTEVFPSGEQLEAVWDSSERPCKVSTSNIRKVVEWSRCSLKHATTDRVVEITEAELQYLTDFLKKEITHIEDMRKVANEDAAYFYVSCGFNDGAFYQLNKMRDKSRKYAAKLKKLSNIQAKLKRAL